MKHRQENNSEVPITLPCPGAQPAVITMEKFAKQTLRQVLLALVPTPPDGNSLRHKGLRHLGENGISPYIMREVCHN